MRLAAKKTRKKTMTDISCYYKSVCFFLWNSINSNVLKSYFVMNVWYEFKIWQKKTHERCKITSYTVMKPDILVLSPMKI